MSYKSEEVANKRIAFIKMCINEPEKAASFMKWHAEKLVDCKYTSQRIALLSHFLFLSERTIERDLQKSDIVTTEYSISENNNN
jgi:hypothetical protein